jgi:hypothetical protein
MNEGYVVVECLVCGKTEQVPMFTGDTVEDLYCSRCESKDIEVW